MHIVIKLTSTAILDLKRTGPATQPLRQTLDQFGLKLEPMHPGVQDTTLETYFTVQVSDDYIASQVIPQLLTNPTVEAAYVKPPDALP